MKATDLFYEACRVVDGLEGRLKGSGLDQVGDEPLFSPRMTYHKRTLQIRMADCVVWGEEEDPPTKLTVEDCWTVFVQYLEPIARYYGV